MQEEWKESNISDAVLNVRSSAVKIKPPSPEQPIE